MVEVRLRTLLPRDDILILGTLRVPVPRRSRSALHRCLQRHGMIAQPRATFSSLMALRPGTIVRR